MTSLDEALAGVALWPHHRATIDRVHAHFHRDPDVLGLLLTGSLAHGFATAASDVDIVLVVGEEQWRRRRDAVSLTYLDHDLATYPGGYIDGKYVSLGFLDDVAQRGADATRWGYDGARILFSRDDRLATLLASIVTFPLDQRAARRERFTAQVLAWQWYAQQGREKGDLYLQTLSISRVVLFACRLVLNENATLFPFHKWLMRVTEGVPHRPADLMERLSRLLAHPSADDLEDLVAGLLAFYGIDRAQAERTWGAHFLRDTELSWVAGPPPVDDL